MDGGGGGGGDGRSKLTMLGLGVLTCNSAMAIYRSWGDLASVLFVVSANAALLLLLQFLRRFERARPGDDDAGRSKAKAAVWALTTLLTAMFASRVAPLMPPLVDVAVWVMAVATAGGGFWALFISHD